MPDDSNSSVMKPEPDPSLSSEVGSAVSGEADDTAKLGDSVASSSASSVVSTVTALVWGVVMVMELVHSVVVCTDGFPVVDHSDSSAPDTSVPSPGEPVGSVFVVVETADDSSVLGVSVTSSSFMSTVATVTVCM